jgi:hypothetical protein
MLFGRKSQEKPVMARLMGLAGFFLWHGFGNTRDVALHRSTVVTIKIYTGNSVWL